MLVLTVLLFHKGRKHPRSLMLAVYASVEVLTNGLNSFNMAAGVDFFIRFPFMHFIYKPLYCLWVPLFYFYFRYCYSTEFRIGKKHWPNFVPFILFFISFLLIWIINGNQYIHENFYRKNSFLYISAYAIDATVSIQYLIYNYLMISSLLKLERDRSLQGSVGISTAVDMRWLRFIVYGYAVGCFGSFVTFVFHLMNSPALPTINFISITYFFLFFFAIFYNTITHKLNDEETKPKTEIAPTADMIELMEKIEELVGKKKLYLEPELSLQQISTLLNEKERNISQAINTIQRRNINDYLNSLRIKHACGLLLADKEKPIFEVMYESGFNTKGAFNQAFKKITGTTPTQFRRKQND
jgi:AraC-like DNA-binding protein